MSRSPSLVVQKCWPRDVKRIVLTFSGQNSQFPGMFQPFHNHAFFDRFLGGGTTNQNNDNNNHQGLLPHVQSIVFPHGNKHYYSPCTSYAQPAILLHSTMLFSYLNHRLITSNMMDGGAGLLSIRNNSRDGDWRLLSMGHSLGEYSALCLSKYRSHHAAGTTDTSSPDNVRHCLEQEIDRAVELVHKRGLFIRQVMTEAMEAENKNLQQQQQLQKQHGMSALLFPNDLTLEQTEYILDFVQRESEKQSLVCDVANVNSKRQIVLSGWRQDVSQVAHRLTTDLSASYGVKMRTLPLQNVAAPFHCRLLAPVAPQLRTLLRETYGREIDLVDAHSTQPLPLSIPIVSNTSATVMKFARDLIEQLPDQVHRPVLWQQSLQTAYDYMTMPTSDGDSDRTDNDGSNRNTDEPVLFIEISPKPTLTAFTNSVLGHHSNIRTLCLTQPSDVDALFE